VILSGGFLHNPWCPMRPWNSLALVLLLGVASGAVAQPKPKPAVGADKFDMYKDFKAALNLKAGVSEKINLMKAGNVNLDPPSKEDTQALEDMAKVLIYPLTQAETYLAIPGPSDSSELVIKSFEAPTVTKVMNKLKEQLFIVPIGGSPAPGQVAFAREFGTALVKAIDDVLAKGPPQIVRVNAIRALAVVAESGAPAAWTKTIDLLKTKDDPKTPLEVLYYGLRSAEACLGSYDEARGLRERNWVQKKTYFELAELVDGFINNPPASIINKTFSQPGDGIATLVTQPTTPGNLTADQIASVQMFRINAVRALAKVKTDIIKLDAAMGQAEKEIRPLFTLCRICVKDTALVAPPSTREIGEALVGVLNIVPGEYVDGDMLGAAIAKGTLDFTVPRIADQKNLDKGVGTLPWKIYGSKLETNAVAFEKAVKDFRCKLPKEAKDMLSAAIQQMTKDCYTPMAKAGNVDATNTQVFFDARIKVIQTKKAAALFTDKPNLQFNTPAK
jgi:hypothetical protein